MKHNILNILYFIFFIAVSVFTFSLFSFKTIIGFSLKKFNFGRLEKLRHCDIHGCGHFGASRGNRDHEGVDIYREKDSHVLCPFDAVFVRTGYVYNGDARYRLLEIEGVGDYSGYNLEIFYIKPFGSLPSTFIKGDFLGNVQDISEKYNGITIHLHIQLKINGILVDAQKYIDHE